MREEEEADAVLEQNTRARTHPDIVRPCPAVRPGQSGQFRLARSHARTLPDFVRLGPGHEERGSRERVEGGAANRRTRPDNVRRGPAPEGRGSRTVFSAFLNLAGHARTKSGQVRPLHMKVAASNIVSTNYVWHIFSLLKLEISTKGYTL
jgi:hypothetical protein